MSRGDIRILHTKLTILKSTLDERQAHVNRLNQVVIYELPLKNGRPDCYATEDERNVYNLARGLDIQSRIAEIRAAGLIPFLLPSNDTSHALTQEEDEAIPE